ncbi:MAG: metalloregulator ArsR/SmtB family transcription factor [Verrucomicrobiales bacterium]|nr:winged helix-turn-helix transcriptional regulator [Verrucomicrobiae bacterium]
MVKYDDSDLDHVFRALADPTRRRIVAALGSGERSVGELAEPLAMSLPAVSKHLGVLERAGLLKRRRDGRTHHLRVDPAALSPAADWIETQRRFWEGSFDQLATYLESAEGSAGE